MLRKHASHRLRIGRYFGIDVFIHWTFWLLLIAVAGSSFAEDSDWSKAFVAVGQILSLFLCVTLHEYGHALTARRFGVNTIDITLLPIGGLARLERMPREPLQELLIAVAGPAVNVVIALVAGIGLYLQFRSANFGSVENAIEVLAEHPLGWLTLMNVVLVLFNLIPAFPMDGGRVLRALLALILDYGRATRLAARCGLMVALAMGAWGIYDRNLTIVLISAFIGYAGWSEARQVDLVDMYQGIHLDTAITRSPGILAATNSLDEILAIFSQSNAMSLPVVGVDRYWLGAVDIRSALAAARAGQWHLRAAELADADAPAVAISEDLASQLVGNGGISGPVAVVDAEGRYLGMLDLRTARLRTELARVRRERGDLDHGDPVVGVLVKSPNPSHQPTEQRQDGTGARPHPHWSGDRYA